MRAFPPVYSPVRAIAIARSVFGGLLPNEGELSGRSFAGPRFVDRRVLLTDSGTSALTLALAATSAPATEHNDTTAKRRVVALPAYGCPDLGTAAIAAGFRIQLYDTDPTTLLPDWESVRNALRAGSTHLVVAHLLGRVVDLTIAADLAAEYGAALIEDAAQGAGGSMRGVPAGALADISILSFGRGKGLNAGGGGALSVAERAVSSIGEQSLRHLRQSLPPASWHRNVRDVAAVSIAELLSQPLLYGIPSRLPFLGLGQTAYKNPKSPHSPSSVNRRLIEDALLGEPAVLHERRLVERWYYEHLADFQSILVAAPKIPEQSGALRFPVLLIPGSVAELERFGLARSYPRMLHQYSAIAPQLVLSGSFYPGASELSETLHTLPTHRLLRDVDRLILIRRLSATIRSAKGRL